MSQAVTSFQFVWEGKKYWVDMPDVNGAIMLPNAAILMIRGCQPFAPTQEELVAAIKNLATLPRAEQLK